MNHFSFIVFFFLLFGSCYCFRNETTTLEERIIGHWKEDQSTRTNLDEFLKQVGVSWLQRKIATTVSWENELIFQSDGDGLELQMINGLLQTKIDMKINLELPSKPIQVDIGEDLGGIVETTSEIVQNCLITTLKLAEDSNDYLIVSRKISADSPDEMVMTTKHVPSKTETSSIYRRIN